jgi:hypothetical protein
MIIITNGNQSVHGTTIMTALQIGDCATSPTTTAFGWRTSVGPTVWNNSPDNTDTTYYYGEHEADGRCTAEPGSQATGTSN